MLQSDQVCHATYDAWMSECISQRAPHVAHDRNINPEYLVDFMRLRLGSNWVGVVTGRWTDGGIARTQIQNNLEIQNKDTQILQELCVV